MINSNLYIMYSFTIITVAGNISN